MDNDARTQEVINNLVMQAALRFAEGKSRTEVIGELEKGGVPRQAAEAVAIEGEAVKKTEFRKGGRNTMALGAGFALLGIVITAGTYAAASGGGTYVVTYGLIVVGAWIFLKGLWRSMAG